MASISRILAAAPVIPEYLEKAARQYQSAATGHARATIGLALSATAYCEELAAGVLGAVPEGMSPKSFVMKVLTKDLPTPFEKSFACRLFAVNELCEQAECQGLTLDRIRSQGSLFALAALVKRATEKDLPICLSDAVEDASTLTIADFRVKWRHVLQAGAAPAKAPELGQVLKWIRQASDKNALRKVAAATSQRLAAVANSQRGSAANIARRNS